MPEGAVMTGLDSDETRAAYRAAFEELMDTMHPGMATAPPPGVTPSWFR